ncbi:hypothetical protein CI109_100185 [Kwoniella shandongensis]|uniref:Uncharacterized protein n=1 Tax=Kwoniella shandongensis TaxID=1734106 RepID=A0A5M6BT26_9TREE|nr:uncharacterized protein CI109_005785 [Kwoniella shandongensis]KAA5525903.1 hypothetical protein CI109_005785 [Kwoniella shandongensis]
MSYNLTTSTLPSLVQTYLPTSLHPFLLLSYPVRPHVSFLHRAKTTPLPVLYDKGPKDVCFVIFWAIAFTLARAFCLRYVFAPFVRWYLGHHRYLNEHHHQNGDVIKAKEEMKERRKREHLATRFSEQAWSCLYCCISWTIGMIILNRIPNPTSPAQLWGTYPYNPIPGLTKFYYLAQLGWWFHQVYVINSEKRRKDHWQMFGHHILSITLITSSYATNFTRVGTLIHVLMDFVDIIFPIAKMLRYLSHTTLCDIAFVIFLVSWLFSRQVGLFLVIRTLYVDAPNYINLEWAPAQGKFLNKTTFWTFLTLIMLLYVLATMWFCMACVVAVRVVRGLGAEDIREEDVSGDEDDGSEGQTQTHVAEKDLEDIPQSVGTTSGANAINGNGNGLADLKKRR